MPTWKIFDKAFRHMDLTDRMMDALGVADRLKSIPEAANALRRASIRCRHCGDPDGCEALLDGREHLNEAPGHCRNRDLFERLKNDIEADRAAA